MVFFWKILIFFFDNLKIFTINFYWNERKKQFSFASYNLAAKNKKFSLEMKWKNIFFPPSSFDSMFWTFDYCLLMSASPRFSFVFWHSFFRNMILFLEMMIIIILDLWFLNFFDYFIFENQSQTFMIVMIIFVNLFSTDFCPKFFKRFDIVLVFFTDLIIFFSFWIMDYNQFLLFLFSLIDCGIQLKTHTHTKVFCHWHILSFHSNYQIMFFFCYGCQLSNIILVVVLVQMMMRMNHSEFFFLLYRLPVQYDCIQIGKNIHHSPNDDNDIPLSISSSKNKNKKTFVKS